MLNKIIECLTTAQIEEQKEERKRKKALKFDNGWIFSLKFRHFQKVKNEVYVYVTPGMFGNWKVQAYQTGRTGICSLEAQINDPLEAEKLFELGEKWLVKYQNGFDELPNDPYFPFHENGWKGRDITDKNLLY